MKQTRTRAITALAAAGALTAAGWAAVAPAQAATGSATAPATAPATATGPSRSVTVFLTPPDRAALAQLAAQPITDRAQRLAQLESLVPSAAQHDAVASVLHQEGFTVGRQSTWSITATAPESVVTDVFGTRPSAGAHPSIADLRAASGPLAKVPAALAGLVTTAYPTTGGPAPFHHQAEVPLAGPDFRNADTPAGVTPSTGAHDDGDTVATLQLASYDNGDLSAYAGQHGLTDPVANGNYQEEQVDGGATSTDGDIEVDLDQESILSTAPSAHQQAYFAPNTDAGFADVFSNVLDDVTDSSRVTYDPHLVAMSVSWGQCEAGWGADGVAMLNPIMQSVVAAGVDIFASSGDDGIYDCRSTSGTGLDNSQEDVDFPASSPAVIAVGGTNLSSDNQAPNTGTNWTETSWTCTSTLTCESTAGTGGTGGGVSGAADGAIGLNGGDFAGFVKPDYQNAVTEAPFASASTRLVPDIAADGDPSTGFELYTSDTMYVAECMGNTCQVGGTSLAAPVSAASFANLLGDRGITTGVGDIHPALYQAYAATKGLAATDPAKVFRDVTVGSNGAAADAKKDPSVNAATGYDTNTGLGGVLWSALSPYLPGSSQGPTVTAKITPKGASTPKQVRVVATWSVKPAGAALTGTTVTLTKGSTTVFTSHKKKDHKTVNATRGATYTLTVTGTDASGHSTTQTASYTAPTSS